MKPSMNYVKGRIAFILVLFLLPLFISAQKPVLFSSGKLRVELVNHVDNKLTFSCNLDPSIRNESASKIPLYTGYIAVPDNTKTKLNILHTELSAGTFPENKIDESSKMGSNPVRLKKGPSIRGIETMMLVVNPLLFNHKTNNYDVYQEIVFEIEYTTNENTYGEQRLRNRWWDQLLSEFFINYSMLPEHLFINKNDETGAEYLIISPNGGSFQAWADSVRKFRTEQGILTHVVTMDEIGGSTVEDIKNFITDAYNSWEIPPAAILLLGDHGTNPENSIPAPVWANYCVSDNVYGDVNGDDLPEIIMARMCAQNEEQLETMVTKFLQYETDPPVETDFYYPSTSCYLDGGSMRAILTESIAGYFEVSQDKNVNRLNVGEDPLPGYWSSSPYAAYWITLFGPQGLGYIPELPAMVNCSWNTTTEQLIDQINAGTFMLVQASTGTSAGWSQPQFFINDVDDLTNTDLPFIWSFNSMTGNFYSPGTCLAEKLHRHKTGNENSGALGVIAPSEILYSYASYIYSLGSIDYLWPDYLPGEKSNPEPVNIMPAFANAAGKFYLNQSPYPINPSNREVIYHLYHCFGDAFTTLYTDIPQSLTVDHPSYLLEGVGSFEIMADEDALIGLSVGEELLASVTATGTLQYVQIPPQYYPDTLVITVTKQNFFRYRSAVPVTVQSLLAQFSSSAPSIFSGDTVWFFDESIGNITGWDWFFEGGIPENSALMNPVVYYPEPGLYDVQLIVTDGVQTDTVTAENYVEVEINSGIDEIPIITAGLTVFPNPSSGNLNVYAADQSAILEYSLVKIGNGSIVASQKLKSSPKNRLNLLLEEPGLYLLKVKTHKGIKTEKVVIY